MHELSIVEGMMGIIEETAKEHALSRVSRIQLRIGKMRQVVPDALQFAFEAVGRGTVAEGAEIRITTVPTKAHCDECGTDFSVEEFCFICTACGSGRIAVIEGKELYIDSLEGE